MRRESRENHRSLLTPSKLYKKFNPNQIMDFQKLIRKPNRDTVMIETGQLQGLNQALLLLVILGK